MDEQSITNGIRAGGLQHDKALSYLYSTAIYRKPIISYMRGKGISATDSETLWTDLVIQFGKLVIAGKYDDHGTLVGYLKNMSGYMVLNHFRDNKKYKHKELDDISYNLSEEEDVTLYNKELKKLIVNQLDLLGDSCKEILLLWSRDYSMSEIMNKVGVVSPEATRKRKHTCLKKLLDNVSNDDETQRLLKEYL